MSHNVKFRELVSINLMYSAGAEPLRDMAYGQLALKTMFAQAASPMSSRQVASEVARVLHVPGVPEEAVERALLYLAGKGFVAVDSSRCWQLSEKGKKCANDDLEEASRRLDSVLQRHFPIRMHQKKLRKWFIDACVEFFGRYAERWVATICHGVTLRTSIPAELETLLNPVIQRHACQEHKAALVAGFRDFLFSTNTNDTAQQRSMGSAMFASRLVAANVTGDPISVALLRDSIMLLDTNVVIAAQLEKHKLAGSLKALGLALQTLHVAPRSLHATGGEYRETIGRIRERLLKVVSRFSPQVVKKAADPFTMTAVARGYSTKEGFERFFAELITMPDEVEGLGKIDELDEPGIAGAVEAAQSNHHLGESIAAAWRTARGRAKPEAAVQHDAGFIGACEYLRSTGRRAFGLTLVLLCYV